MAEQGILVTGAGGFVGRYLCRLLGDMGMSVYGVVRKQHQPVEAGPYKTIFYELGNGINVNDIMYLYGRVNCIVHLAANIDISAANKVLLKDNVVSVQEILKLAECLNIQKIIYMSSTGFYDSSLAMDINESSQILCKSFYHVTKYLGETIFCSSMERFKYGGKYVIFRLSSPIGVGMRMDRFLPVVIYRILGNKNVILLGKGTRVQNYIDVRDVANAISMAIQKNISGIYNLVSSTSYSNYDVAQICCNLIGGKSKICFMGDDIHENERWIFDSKKLNHEMGFSCKYSILDTIEWMISDYVNSNLQ